ncbi:MAG: 1,4-alpha-glucan branching protein GlgB [Clostridiaceae bacterium]|nr:1,4-alpha-glucan branching protein GlgB [Clostridiaceae bacterium]
MNQAYLFNQGLDYMSYNLLGSRPFVSEQGEQGFSFAVWAPGADSVSVVGPFNNWNPSANPLSRQGQTGIWSGFIAGARLWDRYKYAITGSDGQIRLKADPYARHSETRPADASILYDPDDYAWEDAEYMAERPDACAAAPLNIYEVHLGSWKRQPDGQFINYRDLARDLGGYLSDMGYTAVELMPVMEHPLDDSWGYQVTGYYSVTSRYGTPADFKFFVDTLHRHGLRVILDWVPAHFPRDAFGLARFDGTPLFEHPDTRLGEQQEWGTYVFDFGKLEVRSFLISNAYFWLQEFHIDGLRVDAVSSMLYLNYGRTDYLTNIHGGIENLEAIAFLQQLNRLVREKKPECLMIAEESTAWPKVTWPVAEGGLGFTHKWNMGWMHDTLEYMGRDYLYRRWHHHQLSFSLMYAFSEHFILPLSHDEVVHGKHSLIDRMPGDNWRKFASLRALFLYMLTHPGGKLVFMGGEFGQFIEWRFYEPLQWFLLDYDLHRSLRDCVRDLNHYYIGHSALWRQDDSWAGFTWLNADDAGNSVYVYSRCCPNQPALIIVLNLTPSPQSDYILPAPVPGLYQVDINTDEPCYGGSGYPIGIAIGAAAATFDDCAPEFMPEPAPEQPISARPRLRLNLPPLCGLILRHVNKNLPV